MSAYQTWHWRIFNVLARIVGLGFVLWGLGFSSWGLWLLLHPTEPFPVDGVPSTDLEPRLLMTIFAGLMSLLGVALLRVRPYRPDLGDHAVGLWRRSLRRTYWTGDHVLSSGGADA